MRVARLSAAAVAGVVAVAGGCGTTRPDPPPPATAAAPVTPAPAGDPIITGTPRPRASPPVDRPTTAGRAQSPGWTLTVYYTAVQSLHGGAEIRVRGCPRLDCTDGDDDLGAFSADFVQAVRDEGTGRTTTGRYLNWSEDTGFWLDDAPRDAGGRRLRPFESAAADADVLSFGTTFTVDDCGSVEEGEPVPAAVCARLRAARWRITDAFSTGLGGARHLDLYIGEERGTRFTGTEWYVTLTSARLVVGTG